MCEDRVVQLERDRALLLAMLENLLAWIEGECSPSQWEDDHNIDAAIDVVNEMKGN